MPEVLFAAQSYISRTLDHSAQRCVNWFAEAANQSGKNQILIYNSPGLKAFGPGGLAGSIRGAEAMGGVLYIVAGNTFYSIDSAGTATLIGTINTAISNVSMAVNRASPQQLCFVDGTDGWIYDTSGGLQQIVDGDFLAADTVVFQDGYFIFNEAGTSRWFLSNLDNGLAYTATDFADAEGSDDNVVAMFSYNLEVWAFGEKTIEVYYNSGNTDFPFDRITGGLIERGCAAAFSIAADDNSIFWLADDGIVYRRAGGFNIQRISQHGVEEQIRKYTDISDALGFFATFAGHKFYHLIFPTGGAAWVFDIATGLWHERETYGARYWRARNHVRIYGKDIVGDAFQGRLAEMDMDTYSDFGDPMLGIVTGPVAHDQRTVVSHRRLEIDIESGVGDTTGAASDPLMMLRWSDNGGHSWSLRKPTRAMGKIGEYGKRLRWLRMGRSFNRVYELTVADAVKRTIIGVYLNRKPGRV